MIVIKSIPGREVSDPHSREKGVVLLTPEEQFEHFDDTRCGMKELEGLKY